MKEIKEFEEWRTIADYPNYMVSNKGKKHTQETKEKISKALQKLYKK